MPLDAVNVARAVALNEQGYSQRRISRIMGQPRETILDALRRYQETGQYTRRPGQDLIRCTSQIEDRLLARNVLQNRFLTATQASNNLFEITGNKISERTVRRRLAEQNLRSFRPARVPERLPHNRRER